MEKVTWKGAALLAPVPPVLVSCGTVEKPNALTIGWTGILNTHPAKTYISVRPERYSYDIIKQSKEFVINLPTTALVRQIDYCGVKSGANTDKFSDCHFTADAVEGFDCPMIGESPVSLACRVTEIVPLGTHDMFIADIVSVHVSPSIIDETGRMRLAKAGLCAYAHGEYFALGKKIGDFGFSVKKKKKKPPYQKRPTAPRT